MSHRVSPVRDGFHTITPAITVKDPDAAIKFYQKAFGAEKVMCLRGPGGSVMHVELKFGDSMLMMGGEWPDMGIKAPLPNHCSSALHFYFPNVDQAFKRAIDAGCTAIMPPSDMFWGDRYSKVQDPFGHQWGLATHIEDVPNEECARRAAAWKPGGCGE